MDLGTIAFFGAVSPQLLAAILAGLGWVVMRTWIK